MGGGFDKLVDDIIIEVLCALSVPDILSIRQTSKRLSLLTRLRNIWHHKFCCEVLSCNLPIPGHVVPLPSIPASDLEWRTRRAMRLKNRWRTSGPDTITTFDLPVGDEDVHQVTVMAGGRQVLTVHTNRIVLWRISGVVGRALNVSRMGEYVFPLDEVCRVVRDPSSSDIVAVATERRPDSPVVILSTGPGAIFTQLCYYPVVQGVVVGLYDHLLLSSVSPSSEAVGGVEVRDWRSGGRGSILFPEEPGLFGRFLDFQFFNSHILLVWEECLSVYALPNIPSSGQLIADPVKIYRFAEPLTHPVSFTTCKPRLLPDVQPPSESTSSSRSLTIVARPRYRPSGLVHTLLRPLPVEDDPFPFGLIRIPQRGNDQICTASCLGPSGRGVWVGNNTVHRCSPVALMVPFCEMQLTVDLAMNIPVCTIEKEVSARPYCIDFDDGMGRLVVGSEHGKVSIIDLV
ncbi:hypothetical protein JAAARDRAFT_38914 [Jaapia argillacea MUCL 33604]|uniref:F-box domain-containing protein n=1 Tax=Jaapia argillacea MUCL 33604 TaxID=933084 RepID=A0A067PRM0_9AGAM|nr:hypothetical protein JAAARDRAFT_38914 [Jaapia argillacea MUCL 33604]